MSGYFQRLVARAGGGMAPAAPLPLPPKLASSPQMAAETDPFETIAGPEPAADRPDDGMATGVEPSPAASRAPAADRPDDRAQRPVRDAATMLSPGAADGMATRVEPSPAASRAAPPRAARATLAARRPDDRLPPDGRIGSVEQATMHASVNPGNSVAAKPAERLPNQEPSREQASVVPPHPPARIEPLSPGKFVETRAVPAGTIKRIVERLGERTPAPSDGFVDNSPPEPSSSRRERQTPPQAVTLAPPPPSQQRAQALPSDEPRLVIGRLQVDVMPPPVPAAATTRVITREPPARPRTDGRASNLRFGMGQM
jgi:hypothetical protein